MNRSHIHNSDGEEDAINKFERLQQIEDNEYSNRAEAFLRASRGLFVKNIKFRSHSGESLSYETLFTYNKNLRFLKQSKAKVILNIFLLEQFLILSTSMAKML